jgi:hypothetical protein
MEWFLELATNVIYGESGSSPNAGMHWNAKLKLEAKLREAGVEVKD